MNSTDFWVHSPANLLLQEQGCLASLTRMDVTSKLMSPKWMLQRWLSSSMKRISKHLWNVRRFERYRSWSEIPTKPLKGFWSDDTLAHLPSPGGNTTRTSLSRYTDQWDDTLLKNNLGNDQRWSEHN